MCWRILHSTTGNLGNDTVKNNTSDCGKNLSVSLLFIINANYFSRDKVLFYWKRKLNEKDTYCGNLACLNCFTPTAVFAASVFTRGFWMAFMWQSQRYQQCQFCMSPADSRQEKHDEFSLKRTAAIWKWSSQILFRFNQNKNNTH